VPPTEESTGLQGFTSAQMAKSSGSADTSFRTESYQGSGDGDVF
jgi:hypothetical protein